MTEYMNPRDTMEWGFGGGGTQQFKSQAESVLAQ